MMSARKLLFGVICTLIFLPFIVQHHAHAQNAYAYCFVPGSAPPQFTPCQASNPLAVTGAFSAAGFTPDGTDATPLSVSNSTSETALPASSAVVLVQNVGNNVAYVKLGTTSGVTATTSDLAVPPGGGCALTVGSNGFIAGITASSTTTLNLIGGSSLGSACYSGGTVNVPGTVEVVGSAASGSPVVGGPVRVGGETGAGNVGEGSVSTWGSAPNGLTVFGGNVDIFQGNSLLSSTNPLWVAPAPASTLAVTASLASNLVAKSSTGALLSFEVSADSTLSGAAWWVMIFNATSAPSDGSVTPAKCYALPSGATAFTGAFPNPAVFSTGITIVASTTGCFTKTASAHAFISGDVQ